MRWNAVREAVRRYQAAIVVAVVVLAILTVVLIVLAYAGALAWTLGETVGSEIVKAVIQLVAVSLVVLVLTTYFNDQARKREERRVDVEQKLTILRDVTAAYNQVKAARRALTAADIRSTIRLDQQATYGTQMAVLCDAQLDLEAQMRLMSARAKVASGRDKELYVSIEARIRQMEGYVNKVLDGWKIGDPPPNDLDNLAAFLGDPELPGGLEEGFKEAKPKPPKFDGNGPSVQMWKVADEIVKNAARRP
jgi:uncharacterized membrane protein